MHFRHFLPFGLLAGAAACTSLHREPAPHVVRAVVISDLNGSYGSAAYAPEVGQAVRHVTGTWRPDFVLVAGDMIAGQSPRLSDSTVRAMWQAFDSVVAAPLRAAGIPMIITLGNHDGSAYPTHERDRRIAAEHWRRGTPGVAGADFADTSEFPLRHAARFGDVFIASWDDTNQESSTNADLLQWLERALTSDAARTARHRIVLGHLPLFAVAEGRNRTGEVLANGDSLRRHLEQLGATMFVSGHHHAYYPARRGRLELLHAGALGGGPRQLIGSDEPARKTVTVLEFRADAVDVRTWEVHGDGRLEAIPIDSLPIEICGVSGRVVRRDQPDAGGDCAASRAHR